MYESFYGLTEKPFNLTPDPRFLFLSEKHKEAFAHLLYGIKNRTGFIMISGEIGTGKTTICRSLLNQLDPDVEVAFIFNPCLSPEELLRKINEDFGIASQAASLKELIDELNQYLLERNTQGKNCVLVIDEAQNLSPSVLEQIRLLSNLETETQKLLQIILIGQPELAAHLHLRELRQLNQRITARYHLRPLSLEETAQYIAYRLRVAGGRRKVHFSRNAVRAIYKASGGTPRVINAVADRSLLIGYTKEAREITKQIVDRAVREIRGVDMRPRKSWKQALAKFLPNPALVSSALIIVLLAVILVKYLSPVQYVELLPNLSREAVAPVPSEHYGDIAEAKPLDGAGGISPVVRMPDAERPEPSAPLVVDPAPDTAPAVSNVPSKTAEAGPEPPSPAPFVEVLAALDSGTLRDSALASIVRAWNLASTGEYPADDKRESLSAFAQAHGLNTEFLSPALEQLIALNLPALTRVEVKGEKKWVALLKYEDGEVAISTKHNQSVKIPLEEFRHIFVHEALVCWRDDKPATRPLWPRNSGPEVQALEQALKTLNRLAGEPDTTYDDETAKAVARIQAETGLVIDGVAGKQVRMVLASWLSGQDVPSLSPRPGATGPDAAVKGSEKSPEPPSAPVRPAPNAAVPENEAALVQLPADLNPPPEPLVEPPVRDPWMAMPSFLVETAPSQNVFAPVPDTDSVDVRELPPASRDDELPPMAPNMSGNVTPPVSGNTLLVPSTPRNTKS